jgi:hypothetical protein
MTADFDEKTRNRAVAAHFAPTPVRREKSNPIRGLRISVQIAHTPCGSGLAVQFFFHTGNRFDGLNLAGS